MTARADRAALEATARQYMAQGKSRRTAGKLLGVAESTLRLWIPKWEPGVVVEDREATTESDGSKTLAAQADTPEKVMREFGLEPDDYIITSARVTKGGSAEVPQKWLRINARRKDAIIREPDPSTWTPPDLSHVEDFSTGSICFLGDQHAPFHSREAHKSVLNYLKTESPSLVVLLGDAGDHSELSRHRTHPQFAATLNETSDAVAHIFWDYRTAAPEAEFVFLPGNHDARIHYYAQDYAEKLAGVRPGRLPYEDENPAPLISYNRLYRLDECGIKLIEPDPELLKYCDVPSDEDWKLAEYHVTPELTARHGYLTGNSSERKLLETHGRSQVHGHDHHGTVTYRTKHDPLDIRVALSTGTLAHVDKRGLGYQPSPDWTPGIGVGHVWEDDLFVVSFAPFIQNKLLLPDGMRF